MNKLGSLGTTTFSRLNERENHHVFEAKLINKSENQTFKAKKLTHWVGRLLLTGPQSREMGVFFFRTVFVNSVPKFRTLWIKII